MITIKLATTGEQLHIVEKPVIASGDRNSVNLDICCCNSWDDYAISAVFFTDNDDTVYEKLIVDNKCTVPSEVLAEEGYLNIGLRGVRESDVIFTSTLIRFPIVKGAPVGTGSEIEPTPTMYDQLMSYYQEANSNVLDAIQEVKALNARMDAVSATRIHDLKILEDWADYSDPPKCAIMTGGLTFTTNGTHVKVSGYLEVEFQSGFVPDTSTAYGTYIALSDFPEEFTFLNDWNGDACAISGNTLYVEAPLTVPKIVTFDFTMDDYVPLVTSFSNSDLAFEVADARVTKDGTVCESLGEAIRSQFTDVNNYVAEVEERASRNEDEIVNLQEKDMELYDILAGAIVRNASGTDLVLKDSSDRKVKSLKIHGVDDEQDTTTGKNLLGNNGLNKQIINGVTFTPDENGIITVNGTATADTYLFLNESFTFKGGVEYILSGCPIGGSNATYFLYVNGETTYDIGNGYNFNASEDTTRKIGLCIKNGTTVNNLIFKPMIRLATITDATYEKYTGGESAPNVNYPQEIKGAVVSKVTARGKNNLDLRNKGTVTNNGITYTSVFDTDGNLEYIEANGTATGVSIREIHNSIMPAGDYTVNGCPVTTHGTFSVEWKKDTSNGDRLVTDIGAGGNFSVDGKTTVYAYLRVASGLTVENVRFKPMVRRADIEDDTYEPYTENVVNLYESIELHGIGGVADEISSEGVKRRFATVVFDGSDDEEWARETDNSTYLRFAIALPYLVKGNESERLSNFLSTHAYFPKSSATEGAFIYKKNGSCSFYIYVQDVLGLDMGYNAWKAHLAENPITVVYELAEPVIEAFAQPGVSFRVNDLKTYYPVTHVVTDSEIKPVIDLDYVADTKLYIDNKVAEMIATLINN